MTRTANALAAAFRAGDPSAAIRRMAANRPTSRTVARAARAARLNPFDVLQHGDWWDRE